MAWRSYAAGVAMSMPQVVREYIRSFRQQERIKTLQLAADLRRAGAIPQVRRTGSHSGRENSTMAGRRRDVKAHRLARSQFTAILHQSDTLLPIRFPTQSLRARSSSRIHLLFCCGLGLAGLRLAWRRFSSADRGGRAGSDGACMPRSVARELLLLLVETGVATLQFDGPACGASLLESPSAWPPRRAG